MLTPKVLSMKVLVLDDMEVLRTTMVNALKIIGFEDITTANDGLDGLEKVIGQMKSHPFELVFCDVKMPKIDGIEFLKSFKSFESHKTTPVIMVTSEADISTVMDAIQAGANSYILKPFSIKTLEQKLLELFN